MSGETCPHCAANLRGELIPPSEYDEPGAPQRYYSLAIGCEHRGLYDGTLYFMCRFCGGTWHRFPPGTTQHAKAAACGVPHPPTEPVA